MFPPIHFRLNLFETSLQLLAGAFDLIDFASVFDALVLIMSIEFTILMLQCHMINFHALSPPGLVRYGLCNKIVKQNVGVHAYTCMYMYA